MTAVVARARLRLGVVGSPTFGRVAIALTAVIAAYHYSLSTLARNLGVDTPLAYLGLVPLIALMLAVSRSRPSTGELEVHDRQFDYVVGVPLLAGAILILTILPRNLSTLFWVWRLDLLTLPMFVAGTVSLTFGVRALWRIRVAVGFLLLAWPLPYQWSLTRLLDTMTALTLSGIRLALRYVEVAQPIPGQPSFFSIEYAGDNFPVNVASACAGVNGVIGFVLLGLAFGVVVRGGRLRKGLWLAGGITLLWILNIVRILAIFEAGRRWGEATAIDTFHPYVGLVTFNIGAVLMVLAMPLFHLRFARSETTTVGYGEAAKVLRRAVPRFRLAAALIVAVTTVIALANAQLRDYELVADELGAPRLQSFLVAPTAPAGWNVAEVNRYAWARQYFGRDSTWVRFRYTPASSGAWTATSVARTSKSPASMSSVLKTPASRSSLSKPVIPPAKSSRPVLGRLAPIKSTKDTTVVGLAERAPAIKLPMLVKSGSLGPPETAGPLLSTEAGVAAASFLGGGGKVVGPTYYADVITTSNLRSFSTFGIAQCYRFHGYRLDRESEVELGGGITGLLVEYHNTRLDSDWTSASWVWPVRTPEGTRFERVTIMTRVPTSTDPEQAAGEAGVSTQADEILIFAKRLVADRAIPAEEADPAKPVSVPLARPGPASPLGGGGGVLKPVGR